MSEEQKRKAKDVLGENSTNNKFKMPDLAKSKFVKKQAGVLAHLTDWQKRSAETDWVIGDYL